MTKKCTVCCKNKEITDFHKKSTSKDGYRSNCKECSSIYTKKNKDKRKQYDKNYRDENREIIKEKKRKYYIDNIEYFKQKNEDIRKNLDKSKKSEYQKKYYNSPSVKNKIKNYRKEKEKSDPLYKLKVSIRKRISSSFKNIDIKKNSKTESIIGCSFEFFRNYLECLFRDGMTWENHGKWHLDHIIPISLAMNEEELIKLNHYSNFQPLWKEENLSKGNRIIEISQD